MIDCQMLLRGLARRRLRMDQFWIKQHLSSMEKHGWPTGEKEEEMRS